MRNVSGWKGISKVIAIGALALSLGLSGCGRGSNKNPSIAGIIGPNVNFVNGSFTLSMVFQNMSIDAGVRVPINKLQNSYIELGPDFQSNGTLLSVYVDSSALGQLLHGNLNLLDPHTLPGGRPVPGIINGVLPSIAVEVPKWKNMVFYFAPNAFGIFVPAHLGMQNYIGTFRFYDGTGSNIGTLSLVGEDANGQNSGILTLISISGKVATMIK